MPTVAANTATLVELSKPAETSVSKISFTTSANANNVELVVEKAATRPADVPSDPAGRVYHFITIAKTNVADTAVTAATIDFQVEKTWISANNVDDAGVSLSWYANGQWTRLSTTKLREDSTHVYYSAQSPGLSVFAISGGERAATTSSVPTTTIPGTATTVAQAPGGVSIDWGIVITVAVLLVTVLLGASYYKKKPRAFSYKLPKL